MIKINIIENIQTIIMNITNQSKTLNLNKTKTVVVSHNDLVITLNHGMKRVLSLLNEDKDINNKHLPHMYINFNF